MGFLNLLAMYHEKNFKVITNMITVARIELAAKIDFDKTYSGLPKTSMNTKVIKIPNCTIITVQCIILLRSDLLLNSLLTLCAKLRRTKEPIP